MQGKPRKTVAMTRIIGSNTEGTKKTISLTNKQNKYHMG